MMIVQLCMHCFAVSFVFVFVSIFNFIFVLHSNALPWRMIAAAVWMHQWQTIQRHLNRNKVINEILYTHIHAHTHVKGSLFVCINDTWHSLEHTCCSCYWITCSSSPSFSSLYSSLAVSQIVPGFVCQQYGSNDSEIKWIRSRSTFSLSTGHNMKP